MDTKQIRLLLLEDEAAHAEAIRRTLESADNRYQIQAVGSLREYRENITLNPPDIALLDLVLPDGNALELLNSPPEANAFPMLILTSHGNEQAAVTAMKAGALDYIIKSPEIFADMPRILTRALSQWQLFQERKQMEQEVRQSEAKYSSLVEKSNDGIIIIENGILRFMNAKMIEMTGFPRDEALGRKFVDFSPPEERAPLMERHLKRMSGEKVPDIYETTIVARDGHHIPVEINASNSVYQRRPVVMAIVRDITERKKADDALRDSEQRLNEAQAMGRIGSWEFDTKTQIITWSDETYRLYERDKSLGPPSVEEEARYYYPEQAKVLRDYSSRAIETGQTFSHNLELRLPSGKEVYYYSVMQPIKDPKGKVVTLSGTIQDITERKRVEEELRRERDFSTNVVDTAQTIILTLDNKGRIVHFNRYLEEISGYRLKEVQGKNWFDTFLPERYRASIRKLFEQDISNDIQTRGNVNPITTKDGRELEIEWYDKTMKDTSGNISGLLCIGQDVTESRRTEEALVESQSRLENAHRLAHIGVWDWNAAADIVTWSKELYNIAGLDPGLPAPTYAEHTKIYTHESYIRLSEAVEEAMNTGKVYQLELGMVRPDGTHRRVYAFGGPKYSEDGKLIGLNGTLQDITERIQSEQQRELSLKILQLLNLSGKKKDLIRSLLELFKEDGQFEAVGIRLQEGGDYPYFQTNGFPDKFIRVENRLCSVDNNGDMLLDRQGNPLLECMCGNIICGRFDPAKPFFTEEGSFWTNSTTDLLASTTEVDRLARTRNYCNVAGYESVALIPLKSNKITLGLLQINDTRRNCFTIELIKYYEGLAQSIGIALGEKQTEEALQVSETKYRDLYENAPAVYFSVGTDGLVKESNKAAQLLFGYPEEELNGKPRLELYAPECVEKARTVFEKFKSGLPVEDEETIYVRKDGSKVYGLLSAIPVFDKKGHVVVSRSVVKDITDRKRAEEGLKQSNAALYKVMHDTVQAMSVTCDLRDPYTAGHQQRVAQLVVTIAEELHLSGNEKEGLRLAAVIHDIGKMSIPSEILSKPGKLSALEYSLVQMHVQASYDILKGIDFPWPVAQIVYQHHELMDGSGYPRALSGKDIMLEARIITVADVVEAMVSHRPYRPALGLDRALEDILQNRGIIYDAEVVDACLKVIQQKGFKFE